MKYATICIFLTINEFFLGVFHLRENYVVCGGKISSQHAEKYKF